ncbi:uncharacterized protein F5Z01DRAFT_746500 [Emericellopsis atlantica]|uniref:Uncharacterized protein n=1 Tax=Emericellopsis atlantica TaxID=2614577 RepID=A0A9P8CUH4_9HYPO|nr:uncharacterized protein F5Z01DRAFT_746500 [Emericellopsis atlantica]KAG9259167.1 hypothetical protein F5Z01DRAFT_746500 [Emericellopsis atlantica]
MLRDRPLFSSSCSSPTVVGPGLEPPFHQVPKAPTQSALAIGEQSQRPDAQAIQPFSATSAISTAQLTSPLPVHDVDPPRPPRDGYEWAERQIGTLPRSSAPSRLWRCNSRSAFSTGDIDSSSVHLPLVRSFGPTSPAPASRNEPAFAANPFLQDDTHVRSLQQPLIEAPLTHLNHLHDDRVISFPKLNTPEETVSEDINSALHGAAKTKAVPSPGVARRLFLKTKQSLEARVRGPTQRESPSLHKSSDNVAQTTAVIDGARQTHGVRVGTWLEDDSTPPNASRRIFRKAPWHRKESGETLSSVSSSVRELIRADTPPCTPASDLTLQRTTSNYSTSYPGNTNLYPMAGLETISTRPHLRIWMGAATPEQDTHFATPSQKVVEVVTHLEAGLVDRMKGGSGCPKGQSAVLDMLRLFGMFNVDHFLRTTQPGHLSFAYGDICLTVLFAQPTVASQEPAWECAFITADRKPQQLCRTSPTESGLPEWWSWGCFYI